MDDPKAQFVSRKIFRQRLITFRSLLFLVIAGFAVLAVLVKFFDYFSFDLIIARFIQGINLPLFDLVMRSTTIAGGITYGTIIMVITAGILLYLKKLKAGAMVFVSGYGAIAVSEVFKGFIARPRPNPNLIHQIGTFSKHDSFPSGHVLFAVGIYGFLLFLAYSQVKHRPSLSWLLMAITFLPLILMGLSRIYLGAHWFSDVLGAYLIGYIWLFAVVHIYNLLDPKASPA